MNSLDLQAAAEFVGCHPVTLAERTAAGVIPGCKIGKEWRFLDIDLAEYMRQQYPANKPEVKKCRSTSAAKRGGLTSRTGESELDNLLGRQTGTKPSVSMTRLKLICGIESDLAQP